MQIDSNIIAENIHIKDYLLNKCNDEKWFQ